MRGENYVQCVYIAQGDVVLLVSEEVIMAKVEITSGDLLTPFQEFERKHNIRQTRDDIPKKFLGICPSKYYKTVNMDTTKLSSKVGKLLRKLYNRNL